jgi:hypothetical protein
MSATMHRRCSIVKRENEIKPNLYNTPSRFGPTRVLTASSDEDYGKDYVSDDKY